MPIEVAVRVFDPKEREKLNSLKKNKKESFKGTNYKGIIMVEDTKEDKQEVDMSYSKFVDYADTQDYSTNVEHKHRGRPKKEQNAIELTNTTKEKNKEKTPLNSDLTYQSTYAPTTGLLAQSIMQIDDLSSKVEKDLDEVRSSHTLKRKYDYICELSGTVTGLMNNKIMAIREMNNTITNCHKLELSKTKELKLNEQTDDDKRIMDLYNAYINAPVGSIPTNMMQVNPYAGVSAAQLNSPIQGIMTQDQQLNSIDDAGFNNYINNLSPQQNAMLKESDPNIQTIVLFDQSTQDRFFKVVNTQTGEEIPNMPIPNDSIKATLQIDIKAGCARSLELNTSYPLQLIGNRVLNEY